MYEFDDSPMEQSYLWNCSVDFVDMDMGCAFWILSRLMSVVGEDPIEPEPLYDTVYHRNKIFHWILNDCFLDKLKYNPARLHTGMF